ncbi:MAG TPA: anti-sigma factor [Opitutaceae bacterium]|nr:anti-sigma factor [Opitutaceae bacterium]
MRTAAAWLGWVVAACLACSTAYLSLRQMNARAELGAERDRAELTALELRSTEQKAEAERILAARQIADLQQAGDLTRLKIVKLASPTGNSPEIVAIAVWNPSKQQGVLTVANLPRIQNDQDYQLWIIDARGKGPVNGGVFAVDDNGAARFNFHPEQPITAPTQLTISREHKGGAAKPEGAIIATGAL